MVPTVESRLSPGHLSRRHFHIRLISRALTQFLIVVRCPDKGQSAKFISDVQTSHYLVGMSTPAFYESQAARCREYFGKASAHDGLDLAKRCSNRGLGCAQLSDLGLVDRN